MSSVGDKASPNFPNNRFLMSYKELDFFKLFHTGERQIFLIFIRFGLLEIQLQMLIEVVFACVMSHHP